MYKYSPMNASVYSLKKNEMYSQKPRVTWTVADKCCWTSSSFAVVLSSCGVDSVKIQLTFYKQLQQTDFFFFWYKGFT